MCFPAPNPVSLHTKELSRARVHLESFPCLPERTFLEGSGTRQPHAGTIDSGGRMNYITLVRPCLPRFPFYPGDIPSCELLCGCSPDRYIVASVIALALFC
ncbi:hypothetical protein AVEN_130648-1 [Araneus ventricosus]|uniref:Uncharacterized protein n=1 Tax=Araneus ventricosus TaxID=182803 RepID=A0A4Y2A8A9_ARAVE|nr:hypothetical protein AVEN_130648-1 [Araneus ventricosus]